MIFSEGVEAPVCAGEGIFDADGRKLLMKPPPLGGLTFSDSMQLGILLGVGAAGLNVNSDCIL